MGASVSLCGRTETETLVNQLKWLNGWSKKILRGLRMMYNVIETVRNKHHCFGNEDGCDKTFYLSLLDEIAVLLDGPATEMRHNFNLHHVGSSDDELPIHISLERAMEEIDKQCSGKVPVPVMEPSIWDLSKDPIPSVPATFASYVKQICGLSAKVQEIIGGLELKRNEGKEPNQKYKPHFVINMTIVDDSGRPIILPGFSIDDLVNEYNEKRMQEAAAKMFPPGKEANGEVQPTTPH